MTNGGYSGAYYSVGGQKVYATTALTSPSRLAEARSLAIARSVARTGGGGAAISRAYHGAGGSGDFWRTSEGQEILKSPELKEFRETLESTWGSEKATVDTKWFEKAPAFAYQSLKLGDDWRKKIAATRTGKGMSYDPGMLRRELSTEWQLMGGVAPQSKIVQKIQALETQLQTGGKLVDKTKVAQDIKKLENQADAALTKEAQLLNKEQKTLNKAAVEYGDMVDEFEQMIANNMNPEIIRAEHLKLKHARENIEKQQTNISSRQDAYTSKVESYETIKKQIDPKIGFVEKGYRQHLAQKTAWDLKTPLEKMESRPNQYGLIERKGMDLVDTADYVVTRAGYTGLKTMDIVSKEMAPVKATMMRGGMAQALKGVEQLHPYSKAKPMDIADPFQRVATGFGMLGQDVVGFGARALVTSPTAIPATVTGAASVMGFGLAAPKGLLEFGKMAYARPVETATATVVVGGTMAAETAISAIEDPAQFTGELIGGAVLSAGLGSAARIGVGATRLGVARAGTRVTQIRANTIARSLARRTKREGLGSIDWITYKKVKPTIGRKLDTMERMLYTDSGYLKTRVSAKGQSQLDNLYRPGGKKLDPLMYRQEQFRKYGIKGVKYEPKELYYASRLREIDAMMAIKKSKVKIKSKEIPRVLGEATFGEKMKLTELMSRKGQQKIFGATGSNIPKGKPLPKLKTFGDKIKYMESAFETPKPTVRILDKPYKPTIKAPWEPSFGDKLKLTELMAKGRIKPIANRPIQQPSISKPGMTQPELRRMFGALSPDEQKFSVKAYRAAIQKQQKALTAPKKKHYAVTPKGEAIEISKSLWEKLQLGQLAKDKAGTMGTQRMYGTQRSALKYASGLSKSLSGSGGQFGSIGPQIQVSYAPQKQLYKSLYSEAILEMSPLSVTRGVGITVGAMKTKQLQKVKTKQKSLLVSKTIPVERQILKELTKQRLKEDVKQKLLYQPVMLQKTVGKTITKQVQKQIKVTPLLILPAVPTVTSSIFGTNLPGGKAPKITKPKDEVTKDPILTAAFGERKKKATKKKKRGKKRSKVSMFDKSFRLSPLAPLSAVEAFEAWNPTEAIHGVGPRASKRFAGELSGILPKGQTPLILGKPKKRKRSVNNAKRKKRKRKARLF